MGNGSCLVPLNRQSGNLNDLLPLWAIGIQRFAAASWNGAAAASQNLFFRMLLQPNLVGAFKPIVHEPLKHRTCKSTHGTCVQSWRICSSCPGCWITDGTFPGISGFLLSTEDGLTRGHRRRQGADYVATTCEKTKVPTCSRRTPFKLAVLNELSGAIDPGPTSISLPSPTRIGSGTIAVKLCLGDGHLRCCWAKELGTTAGIAAIFSGLLLRPSKVRTWPSDKGKPPGQAKYTAVTSAAPQATVTTSTPSATPSGAWFVSNYDTTDVE
ncbi:hypothetical protein C8R45DRAFT_929783 [Mycena sanguinolenta]|nr:hypothetical protein C8R45DRAFT_929783 [Mycena sanguinolenta]